MKKLLAFILICSSFVFAKEHRSHTYAHVDYSEPIYEYRYDRVYDDYEDDYYHRSDYSEPSYHNDNSLGLDTLVGATIGVAIGNQIGKGNGRDVARVVGGLLGASVANNTRYERAYTNHRPHYKKRHKKHRSYSTRKTKVLVGYKNHFRYKRNDYFKITDRPRKKIRITKTISF